MSTSLSSCAISDLQSVGKKGRGWKGGQEKDGKKRQQTYTIQSLFKLNLFPLATLALPAKLRLTGMHLPLHSSPVAPNPETKEDYRHYAARRDKD